MKRYKAQKGDISRWPYRKVEYAQEYNGYNWSEPIDLNNVATADPAIHARVMRQMNEPERYEMVHSTKRFQKKYYREKEIENV